MSPVQATPASQDQEKIQANNEKSEVVVVEYPIDEKKELQSELTSQSEDSLDGITAEAAAALAMTYPSVTMPGRRTVITRIRHGLTFLNLFIPVFLETTGIISTAPWMSILAAFFAGLGAWGLHRQFKKSEIVENLEATIKGKFAQQATSEQGVSVEESVMLGKMVRMKNEKYLKVMRVEICSAWWGAVMWVLVCLMWVLTLVLRKEVEERYLAVVVCSALEASMCLALGVLMTRYRKRAVQEIKAWHEGGAEEEVAV